MKVTAIARVKDEADIIGDTVTWMLGQVDEVIVSDNSSTDGTRELLEQLDVYLLEDPDPAYRQSLKMTELAMLAAKRGADWVVAFDADEAWYSPFGRIADILGELPAAIATAAVYDHVPTALDPAGAPLETMGWRRRDAQPLVKVACRPLLPATILQGNHGAAYNTETIDGQLVVRHYPYRSAEQFVAKVRNGAAAYAAATEIPEHEGAHWRAYGRILDGHGEEACADIFRKWHWRESTEIVRIDGNDQPALLFDPFPACASAS